MRYWRGYLTAGILGLLTVGLGKGHQGYGDHGQQGSNDIAAPIFQKDPSLINRIPSHSIAHFLVLVCP